MANMTVVRNAAYTKGGAGIRERHNERKNECYANADIQLERSPMNVHFKQCEGSYTETFDKLLTDGTISTRGLKPDAKVIDEMIFDVNTLYFEEKGGYDYAKRFYKEAYRFAVKTAGNEQYILSAVIHTDEVNVGASAALGKDVYHYHLHVVYIPVVKKEIYFSKRSKDKAGQLKEVINQVSHSKKWPREVQLDENDEIIRNDKGKAVLINSYSLLQDRFYEYMKEAGFKDFERGVRGSTTEHQSDAEFKIQKDMERLERLGQAIEVKEAKIAELDEKTDKKKKQITTLDKKLSFRTGGVDDLDYLDKVGKKNVLGQLYLTPKELKKVRNLAEKGADARGKIYDLEQALERTNRELSFVRSKLNTLQQSYDELLKKAKPYLCNLRGRA